MANITKGTSSWNVNVEPGETVTLNTGKSYVDRNIAVYANNSIPWSNITGKPTTLSGYGITDGLKSDTKYAASDSVGGSANNLKYFQNTSNTNMGQNTDSSNGIGYITDYSGTSLTANVKDGALYRQAYSTNWVHEIYGDYRTGQIALRGKNNGTWQGWRVVLDSSNYTNYAPSKTGTGASGTWGISISGNADTASNASKVNGHTVNSDVPTGAKFTDTNTWRPLGTTADTACAGNDSRLSDARPASDVSAWAKAASKPSYSYNEISDAPSILSGTDTPAASLGKNGDIYIKLV